jgi:hypothetical protein
MKASRTISKNTESHTKARNTSCARCCSIRSYATSPLPTVVVALTPWYSHHCHIIVTSLSHRCHTIVTPLSHHFQVTYAPDLPALALVFRIRLVYITHLVPKIKPCMSKFIQLYTVKLRTAHYISNNLYDGSLDCYIALAKRRGCTYTLVRSLQDD